jgi:superfamily I DNA and RNA helicase
MKLVRPDRNSPVHIPLIAKCPLIEWFQASFIEEEVSWVAAQIRNFIELGLQPEEIAVISLDDRHAKNYLSRIAEALALHGIATNNIIADPYNEPPFTMSGKVSLSTVYRAKGNEAAAVLAVGIDAVELKVRDGRNKLFTAFTRSKAWLRISGFGRTTAKLPVFQELERAVASAPVLEFIMPDLAAIETIQRGLSQRQAKAKAAREEYIKKLRAAGYSDDEIDEELASGTDK